MSKPRLDYYQHGACHEKWIQRFDPHFSITYHGYKDGDKKIIDKVLVMASDNVRKDESGKEFSRFNTDTGEWLRKNWKRGEWNIYCYNGKHFNVVNDIVDGNLYLDVSYNISMDEFVAKYADPDYPVVYEETKPLKIDAKYFANWLRGKDCYVAFIHNMYKHGAYSSISDLIENDGDKRELISLAFEWSNTTGEHEFWDDIDSKWGGHLEELETGIAPEPHKKKKVAKAATKKNPETDIFEF